MKCAVSMPVTRSCARAQIIATRAITIDVPPERVWPWIVQLATNRAGFYTYDLIDDACQQASSVSSRSTSSRLPAT